MNDKKKENEVEAWTVATGNFNPLIKASRKAVEFCSKLDGLLGVHPEPPRGTLWLFESENAAKIARNKMKAEGIETGRNICKCFVEKQYLKKEK